MANITKSPSVNNYKNLSSSKVRSTAPLRSIVSHVYGKGETHNTPDHKSGNERFIIDAFYSNAHNLKASFIRLSNKEADSSSLKNYYRTHEEEVLAGASDLVEAIHSILKTSNTCDQDYGTHFRFLIESILNDFEASLIKIGISHRNYKFSVNKFHFFDTLCETPEMFEFLFKFPNGLIEMLSRVHLKIQSISDATSTEGRIIDYRT